MSVKPWELSCDWQSSVGPICLGRWLVTLAITQATWCLSFLIHKVEAQRCACLTGSR